VWICVCTQVCGTAGEAALGTRGEAKYAATDAERKICRNSADSS